MLNRFALQLAVVVTFLTQGSAAHALFYDLASDFGQSAQAAPFSYGYANTAHMAFTQYDTTSSAFLGVTGLTGWTSSTIGSFPFVGVNRTTSTVTTQTLEVPGSTVVIHPGPASNDELSIVRFTAPTSGSYTFSGVFMGLDFGTRTVSLVYDSTTTLFGSTTISGDTHNTPLSFSVVTNMNAGDTMDFTVGTTGVGNNTAAGAGLRGTISTDVPEPGSFTLMSVALVGMVGWAVRRRGRSK
jgi:hypothetical protein